MKIQGFKKGVSVYLSLIIMTIVLAIGLGLTTIIISQISTTRGMGNSVVAFYLADTGIEHILYNTRHLVPPDYSDIGPITIGGGSYNAEYSQDFSEEFWRSVGYYQGTKRAIQTHQPIPFDFSFTADATDFCIQSSGGSSLPTNLHAIPISGGPEPVTFSIWTTIPQLSGVTGTFNPQNGSLLQGNPAIDSTFSLLGDGSDSDGTYRVTIIADTAPKDLTIDMTLVIKPTCP